jgi:hypothetical protein
MTLRDELEPFASNGREAFRIVENVFDGIVAAIRRDPRLAEMKMQGLELLFADVRAETERCLFDELRDRVHLDAVDVVDGVEP